MGDRQLMLRPATQKDVDEVMRMVRDLKAAVAESAPFSEATTSRLIADLIRSPRGMIHLACLPSGRPVGFIAGAVGAYAFAPVLEAQELLWWVDPKYRKTDYGPKLMDAFERWARGKNAAVIGASYSGKSADALFRRRGMVAAERKYMKVV